MENKTLVSSLFAIILMAAVVIAAASVSVSPNSLAFTTENQVHTVTVGNLEDNSSIEVSTPSSVTDGKTILFFSVTNSAFSLNGTDTDTFTVSLLGNPQDLEFGIYETLFNVTATSEVDPFEEEVKGVETTVISGFCSAGSVGGDLVIENVKIDNRDGDDDEWILLDTIEVEFEIGNDGDDDVDDVQVEIALYDSNGDDITNDLDFENKDDEQIDIGDIRDGDDEKDTFTFRIPADIDDGNYRLAIKAYSDDLGESVECVDFADKSDLNREFYEEITIDREDDDDRQIIVDDIILDSSGEPGDLITGTFTVFNVGDDTQERVLITMKNTKLGVDQEFEITQDMDEGDDKTLSFSFAVPGNAENGNYNIEFETFYDYKRGVYREAHEDTFLGLFTVIGGTGPGAIPLAMTGTGDVSITATLGSDAEAGEKLIVDSIITNTGLDAATFVVDAKGFSSWAELDSVSPRIVTLVAGQSAVVEFVFLVDEDASGSESFVIETNSNGNIEIQEVEVNIASDASGSGFNFGDNNTVWIIAIINIILIILIILVAVRLSRR